MASSSNSEHLAALASAVDPSSLLFFSEQTESIEEQIEQSKTHWCQTTEFNSDEEGPAEISNVEAFKTLQLHPAWGTFFKTFGRGEDSRGELEIGEKFAEGGQAELYNVQVYWRNPVSRDFAQEHGTEYVLKVFKRGTFLRRLKSQWPKGMLKFYAEKLKTRHFGTKHHGPRYFCDVVCGTLLEDGRFAFVMVREKGDLRKTIDNIMKHKVGGDFGPFEKGVAKWIMYAIAQGMASLHKCDIVHRDLKASNVLITKNSNFVVADFESSVGVIGTGFFRAPEILQACQDGDVIERHDVFSKKADVYAYGMTCYEILTGKFPFEGHSSSDVKHVLEGQWPIMPKYVDNWACELLHMCWQTNPNERPSFGKILKILKPTEREGEVLVNWPCESEVILFPVEEVERKQWDALSWLRRWCAPFISRPTIDLMRGNHLEVHHLRLPLLGEEEVGEEVIMYLSPCESEVTLFLVEEVEKKQWDVISWLSYIVSCGRS